MGIRFTVAILALASALDARQSWAQTNITTTNPALFRVAFSANCLALNHTKGRVVSHRLTDRDIVAQATGLRPSNQGVNPDFALVYNADEDSLQVANAQGVPILDVVHFGGGALTGDTRQTDRFTFMFFPGQTNEFGVETNVFGSAVITERTSPGTGAASATRANITGRLQFTLEADTPLGTTNLTASPGTNAEICVGLFTTSRRFPSPVAAMTGASTNAGAGTNGAGGTTPIVIIIPNTTVPITTSSGTTTTALGSTVGMLPSLTGSGSLPGLGTSIGTGQIPLTPFTSTTPLGVGNPVNSIPGINTTVPSQNVTLITPGGSTITSTTMNATGTANLTTVGSSPGM